MNTWRKTMLLTAFLCGVFFCLSAPAWAEQTVPPVFVSSGLLAKADESAEEILLRAHQLDRGAIILTTIGYYQGIGGFPQSPFLSAEWSSQLIKVNDFESLSLLTLMLRSYIEAPDKDFAGVSAMCPAALSCDLAPLLKQEGLFDVEQFCGDLKQKKSSTPNWDTRYAEVSDTIKLIQKRQSALIGAIRAFRDEPCSPELLNGLYAADQNAAPGIDAFYAATTHNPATDVPDWSAERLLQYFDKLTQCPQQAKQETNAESEKNSRINNRLTATAVWDIFSGLLLDKEAVLSTIRSAHNFSSKHSVEAIRAMAAQYRTGSPGFPQSDMLSDLWLQHAAFTFDNESRLLLAIIWFMEKRYAEAWAWADTVGKDRDAAEETKKLAAQLTAMIEDRAGKDVQEKGKQIASAYFKATNDLIDWFEQQP